MTRGRPKLPETERERRSVSLRLNEEDYNLLCALQDKKRLKFTDLLRQAIRLYAEQEKLL